MTNEIFDFTYYTDYTYYTISRACNSCNREISLPSANKKRSNPKTVTPPCLCPWSATLNERGCDLRGCGGHGCDLRAYGARTPRRS